MKTLPVVGFMTIMACLQLACSQNHTIHDGDLTLEINDDMYTRVNTSAQDSGLLGIPYYPGWRDQRL